MSESPPPGEERPEEAPQFDIEAARLRYRRMMRGRIMKTLYAITGVVILFAWGLGIAAMFSSSVEGLPNHDISVPPQQCIACHSQPTNNAPVMSHPAMPTCGFCHRQSFPEP
ncbi:MAG: hypothetical protein MI924_01080 [Chloroflexales bacterium]|nr:hypothetical protein [Chloroflexales bacterium]